MREDEHGWDPKGPPQFLDLRAAVDERGDVLAWDAQAWLPAGTAGLPNIPLLGPQEAGISQPMGRPSGLIQQNVDTPYRVPNMKAVVHWLQESPLRPSNIRAPGNIANSFATESFTDEVAALIGVDPVEFRLTRLTNPRGIEVLRRAAARMGCTPRISPQQADKTAPVLTGHIHVTRVVCAHDCGLMVNPDLENALSHAPPGNTFLRNCTRGQPSQAQRAFGFWWIHGAGSRSTPYRAGSKRAGRQDWWQDSSWCDSSTPAPIDFRISNAISGSPLDRRWLHATVWFAQGARGAAAAGGRTPRAGAVPA